MADALKKASKAHTIYKLADGTRVCGTTTILGVISKPALIYWSWDLGMKQIDYRTYKDLAADIGTLAHAMVVADLMNEQIDTGNYSKNQIDAANECMKSYYNWKSRHTIKVLFCEKPLVDEVNKFGGTPDIYAEVDGIITLLDLKTGKKLYDEHYYQVAGAYVQLLVANKYKKPKQVIILNIPRKEGEEFDEKIYTDYKKAWQVFKNCLTLYKLLNEKGA